MVIAAVTEVIATTARRSYAVDEGPSEDKMEYRKAGTNLRFSNVQILAFVLILTLVIVVGIAGAQTSTHSNHANNAAVELDIAHDPADVPAPVGNRNPGVVQVTMLANFKLIVLRENEVRCN